MAGGADAFVAEIDPAAEGTTAGQPHAGPARAAFGVAVASKSWSQTSEEREAVRKIDHMRIFDEDSPYVEGYKGTMYLTRRDLREAVLIMREFPHLDKRDGDNLLKLPERMWRKKRRGGRSQRERRERRVQRERHERRVACRRMPREQQARKPRLGPGPESATEPAPDPTDDEGWVQRLREERERRNASLPEPFEDLELLPNGSDGASDNAPAPAPAPAPCVKSHNRTQQKTHATIHSSLKNCSIPSRKSP